jgi:Sec-independent protein translocase protein TatA
MAFINILKSISIFFVLGFVLLIPFKANAQNFGDDLKLTIKIAKEKLDETQNNYNKSVEAAKTAVGDEVEKTKSDLAKLGQNLDKAKNDYIDVVNKGYSNLDSGTQKTINDVIEPVKTVVQNGANDVVAVVQPVTQKVVEVVSSIKPSDVDPDVLLVKSSVGVPKGILNSLKAPINNDVGEFINITNQPYFESFKKLAVYIFIFLVIIEIILVLLGQNKFENLISNFFISILNSFKYIIFITIILEISNLFMRSTGTGDFVGYLTSQIGRFERVAELNSGNWTEFFIAKVVELPKAALEINYPIIGFISSLATPKGQLFWTATSCSWLYLGLALGNWFGMFIVNTTLALFFLVSPIVALVGISEWGRNFQDMYWAIFWDCVLAKIGFHLVLWFFNVTLLSGNEFNFLFVIKSIIAYIALPIIVLKFRSAFVINNVYPDRIENKPAVIINQVASQATSVVQSTAQMSQNLIPIK